MRYDWRNNSVLFVHNLDAKPREVKFSVGLDKEHAEEGKVLVNLLGEEHSRADKNGKHRLVIEGYGYRVGGLDYLLRRSDIDQLAADGGSSGPKPADAIVSHCVRLHHHGASILMGLMQRTRRSRQP